MTTYEFTQPTPATTGRGADSNNCNLCIRRDSGIKDATTASVVVVEPAAFFFFFLGAVTVHACQSQPEGHAWHQSYAAAVNDMTVDATAEMVKAATVTAARGTDYPMAAAIKVISPPAAGWATCTRDMYSSYSILNII
jgi:hypothetical protein